MHIVSTAKHVARAASLALVFLVAACVITTEHSYFDAGDYVQPQLMKGDWVFAPGDPGDDKLKVRIAQNGKMWQARPLTAEGAVDPKEDPVNFGLVDLGSGEYILVAADSDSKGGAGSYDYLGLVAAQDKLTFYLFSGGESANGKAKFDALVTSLDMAHDPSFSYEARLTGKIDKSKLKTLFQKLMAEPAIYDAHPAIYTRIAP